MSERYHIEEILSQDELGVLFRAVDQKSGRPVALRRFFPFGRDGGGLEEHETAEYRSAVGQIASLSDPALRQVLDGGCDPVDGIPYLVTEWVDGEALDALLTRGECEPDAVVDLLDRALALCMVISAKLGTEAVWLDTSPAMVVLDGGEGGRGVTFSISAIRWLVETRDRRSFEPLAVLAEEMMGWRGRLVGDQAGGGLGGWIKWTRNNGQTATQAEARLVLARMTGRAAAEPVPQVIAPPTVAAPPPPTAVAPQMATPTIPTQRIAPGIQPLPMGLPPQGSKSGKLWIVMAILIVLIGGVAWWGVTHSKSAVAASEAPPPGDKRLEDVNARAAKYAAGGAPSSSDTVFAVGDDQAIRNENGKTITVEGVVRRVYASNSGKTLYLEFAGAEMPNQARGRVVAADVPALTEEALKRFEGKKVRVTGDVRIVQDRAEITLTAESAIKEP
ncbi:MAG: hypothetical protein J0M04_24190 [Verrucomicrobia bacterium]|nr:hypothetical protein [Verrucomicrobiota bacterium]